MKKNLCFMVPALLLLSGVNAQTLTDLANGERIVLRPIYPATNTSMASTAATDQTTPNPSTGLHYNADTWAATYIHRGDTVTQGIGGPRSRYYSVPQALHNVSRDSVRYWESLQVRRYKNSYRHEVRQYIVNSDSIYVAIGKVLANTTDPSGIPLGGGGAWQFFIQLSDTIYLTPVNIIKLK